jgi:hypothetical protein
MLCGNYCAGAIVNASVGASVDVTGTWSVWVRVLMCGCRLNVAMYAGCPRGNVNDEQQFSLVVCGCGCVCVGVGAFECVGVCHYKCLSVLMCVCVAGQCMV